MDNWTEKARAKLGEVLWMPRTGTEVALMSQNKNFGVVGIIANLENRISRDIIDNYATLKFIASCSTGLDHIDTRYAEQKDIKIISLQGERDFLSDVWATAEMTWNLILSLARRTPFVFNDVCAGNWEREKWQGIELHSKKLGIIGLGRLGRQILGYAEAFGMFPLACDKDGDLEFVLSNADIVSVHIPLNNETKGLFSAKQFKSMKSSSFFINTSRGQIVDEEALLWALKEKEIAGAALDVVCNEPNINKELMEYANTHDNLVLTCHIGGQTRESREKTQIFIANKIKEYIQNAC